MKKLFFFSIVALMLNSCHKDKPIQLDTIHTLIFGLPSDTKLPNMDTTDAFSYIIGTVGDLPFSIVSGKDSVEIQDDASYYFYLPYDSTMVEYGASGWWQFRESEQRPKHWTFEFSLPSMPIGLGPNAYKKRKIDLTTPQIFKNIGGPPGVVAGDSTKGNLFSFLINRTDSYNGQTETRGFTTWTSDQKDSYMKLISVKHHRSPIKPNYNYELMYEFDVNVGYLPTDNVRMKGRAKMWIQDLIL